MDTKQLAIFFAAAIINEFVRRLSSFVASKLKTSSGAHHINTFANATFNKLLIVVLIQGFICSIFIYNFIVYAQQSTPVSNLSVAVMIVLFTLTLRVSYNFLKAINRYVERSKTLYNRTGHDVQSRNTTNA